MRDFNSHDFVWRSDWRNGNNDGSPIRYIRPNPNEAVLDLTINSNSGLHTGTEQ